MNGNNIELLTNNGELSTEEYQFLAQKTVPELIVIIANLKKDSYNIMSIVEDEWMKRATEWQASFKVLDEKYQQLNTQVKH